MNRLRERGEILHEPKLREPLLAVVEMTKRYTGRCRAPGPVSDGRTGLTDLEEGQGHRFIIDVDKLEHEELVFVDDDVLWSGSTNP